MEKIKFLEGIMEMEYTRSPGKVTGRFLSEIRDHKEILGIRCSKCSLVFVPPQQFCPDCHIKMSTYVPMPSEATIESFTIVQQKMPFLDWEPPYAYAAIKFDGANTLLWHRIKNVDAVKNGATIVPVFKSAEERTGSILDIDYFEIKK